MKTWHISYISKEMAGDSFGWGYTGQWADELIDAESELEAVALFKQWIVDNLDWSSIETDVPLEYVEANYLVSAKPIVEDSFNIEHVS